MSNIEAPSEILEASVAARRSGRPDEAEQLLAEATERYPADPALAVEYATAAERRADWVEVQRRCERVEARFPWHPVGVLGVGKSLLKLGRLDEADAKLAAAFERFSNLAAVGIAHAQVANARGDWSEALRRWQSLRERFPDSPEVITGHGQALWHFQIEQAEANGAGATARGAVVTTRPGRPAAIGTVTDKQARDLLLNFQSIGGNCELGLVQRHFEAEPLGLLRWATTYPDHLLALLESGFDGLGEAAHLTLKMTSWGEYFVQDTKYGLGFHTFISEHEADAATVLRKQGSRLVWLKAALIEELRAGGKIFVYKFNQPASDALVRAIHAAMLRYGRNTLLAVRVESKARPSGSVERAGAGLLHGYLDRVGPIRHPDGTDVWDISFDAWIEVCKRALRLSPPLER